MLLRIRKEQVQALGEVGRSRFAEEMIDHLNAFCPELCRTLEEDVLRAIVWQAFERAEGYGLACRGSLRLFLEAMVLLGSGFDEDPQYPWAREVLASDEFPNEMFKSGRLEHLLREYLEKVNGEDKGNAIAALQKIRDLAQDQGFVFRQEMLAADIQKALRVAFPAKLRHVEQTAVDAVIGRAARLGREVYAAPEARPIAVLAILMFAFGAGCAEDPFYPWIGATLRDEKIVDDASRASRLERKALTWLSAVLEGAEAAGARPA